MTRKYSFYELKQKFHDKPYPNDVNEFIENMVKAAGFPIGELVKARLTKAFYKVHLYDENDPLKTLTINFNNGIVDKMHKLQRINFTGEHLGKFAMVEESIRNETTSFKKEEVKDGVRR